MTITPWWVEEARAALKKPPKQREAAIAKELRRSYELGEIHGAGRVFRGLQSIGLICTDDIETFRLIGDSLLSEIGEDIPKLMPSRMVDE